MAPERPRASRAVVGLAVAAAVALAATVWAIVAWQRAAGVEDALALDRADLPVAEQLARRLATLQAELGTDAASPAQPDAADAKALIPVLEKAAAAARISRESLGINTENPRTIAGRTDVREQETEVDLKAVTPQAAVTFLVGVQKEMPGIEIREIILSQNTGEAGWTARVRLVLTLREAPAKAG